MFAQSLLFALRLILLSALFITTAFDIDGNTRPNPAGSNPDIGAYENNLSALIAFPDIRVEPNELGFKKIAGSSTSAITSIDNLQKINYDANLPAVPGEILVKFKSDTVYFDSIKANGIAKTSQATANAIFNELQVHSMSRVFSNTFTPLGDIYRLKFSASVSLFDTLKRMASDPNVEWVEPNYIVFLDATPNDSSINRQWGIHKIEAELAWDVSKGGPDIVIAIIDTGVDYDHPDLNANIWHNPHEIPGNGKDDDHNGFIDDDIGWDFVSVTSGGYPGEDIGPRDRDPMDFHGHGTYCAGIASAVTDNNIGIAGTAWNCKIMALRAGFKNEGGSGVLATADYADALHYAANNGAHVINMSWGGGGSNTQRMAIQYAQNKGCVLVASAGNDNAYNKQYPAAYPEVIAVASSDQSDNKASFSNYGYWVDIAAPGVSIYSTAYNDTYGYISGTSASAPFVAGVAALALSLYPMLTPDEVAQKLIESGDDIDWGVDGPTKRLNAYRTALASESIIAVYNDGTGDLHVTNIAPEHGSSWLQTNLTNFTVPIDDYVHFTVLLDIAELDPGSYVDRLLIYSDDPDENPYPDGIGITLEITNNPPYITSLIAAPNPVDEDKTSTVTVVAFDDDGHTVSYDWHTTGGSISGSGNVVTYHPPDVSQQTTYTVGVTVSDGYDSDTESVDITVNSTSSKLSISMVKDWNLVSLPLQPLDTTLATVLADIWDDVRSVWAYNALTGQWERHVKDGPVFLNNLTDMEAGKGYWLDVENAGSLTVWGTQPPTTIDLYTAWNLVGYNLQTPKDIAACVESIETVCEAVWGYDVVWKRRVKDELVFLNDLTEMKPNFGYWIDTTADVTWDVSGSAIAAAPRLVSSRPYFPTKKPEIPYVIWGSIGNNGVKLAKHDNCTVILQVDDHVVSTYKLGAENGYGDLYVLRVPPVTDDSQQAVLYVQLSDKKTRVASILPGKSGQTMRFDISMSVRPDISILHQNFPNPFNPETWIPYQLREDADVVIKIYTATGQVVRTLRLGQNPAGFYTDKEKAAHWDGRNDDGESVASGVYFYYIEADGFSATRKMTVKS